MRLSHILAGLCFVAAPCLSPAQSQMSVPYQAPDLSQYPTNDQLNAAIANATPPDCPAPLSDALVASAGTQPKCMPRPDAQRATQVQSTTAITNSDGTFSGTWPVPFANAPTGRLAEVEVTSATAAPYKCAFITGGVTATGYSGKCWQIVATTLPTTLAALGGLVVSPIQNAAAGLTVRITGRL